MNLQRTCMRTRTRTMQVDRGNRAADHPPRRANGTEHGFTLPEVLVVCGIIAALVAILLPALGGGLRTAQLAKSQTRLKQISTWMTAYSSENREYIVPSQFDYVASAAISPVKVRSMVNPPVGAQYQGTWTDILWTYSGQKAVSTADGDRYIFDSPDSAYYATNNDDDNVFRAARPNTRNSNGDGIATPFGSGAHDIGQPGFFAANDFFNSRADAPASPSTTCGNPPVATPAGGRWYVTGQIKVPEMSMYLVDSLAGETIAPVPVPWNNPAIDPAMPLPSNELQVDFRYNLSCLMLFLDGHSETQAPWRDLEHLEGSVDCSGNIDQQGRNVRVSQLTKSGLPFYP